MTLSNYKFSLAKTENDLRNNMETIKNYQITIKKLETDLSDSRAKMRQYFEIAMMQKEEMESLIAQNKDLRQAIERMKERISVLDGKLSKLTKNQTENQTNPEEENFNSDMESLKIVRSHFGKVGNLIKRLETDIRSGLGYELLSYLERLKKIQRNIGGAGIGPDIEDEPETYEKRDLNIQKYCYFRPSFFIFIEER